MTRSKLRPSRRAACSLRRASGKRSDQALLAPEPVGIAAQQRVVGGRAGDVELGLQLLAPLPDQRRRRQHEHALDHAAQQVLLEHHAGLDGLAEPDLVGEQHPAAKLLEHLAHGLDLVPEGFDAAQMRQAEQLVEALRQAEMGEALAQPVPAAVAFRRACHGGQERREIELGAERDIDVDPRQPGRRLALPPVSCQVPRGASLCCGAVALMPVPLRTAPSTVPASHAPAGGRAGLRPSKMRSSSP